MDYNLIYIVLWILSGCFSILVGAGILTYIRRTWQLMRAESEGSVESRLLDSLDQVQVQLYSMSERLERLEGAIESGNREDDRVLPPANDG